jgi:hypothetical protein
MKLVNIIRIFLFNILFVSISLQASELNNINTNQLKEITANFESKLYKFAKECGEEFPKSKQLECLNLLKDLERLETKIETLSEDTSGKIGNAAFCNSNSESLDPNIDLVNSVDAIVQEVACTQKEKESYKASCLKDVMCFGASSLAGVALLVTEAMNIDTGNCLQSQNSCGAQAITALIDTLWSSITGIWNLLEMGYDATTDWVSDKWNSFWDDTEEIENKSSNAQMMLANLSAEQKKQIEEDKEGWLASTMKGLWSSLEHWMSHDIYCQQWSGAPRYSTCLKPFQSDCIKCDTLLKGSCALIGVVASEIVTTYLTGGVLNVVGRGAKLAVNSSKALSIAVDGAKSLIKIPTTGVKNISNIIGKTSTVQRSTLAITSKLTSIQASSAYKLFKNVAKKSYKYSGAEGLVKINKKAFTLGEIHSSKLMRVKYKNNKVFIDATNKAQMKSLKNFSDSVIIDDEIAQLMENAHLAPDGFTKNKNIKLLIDKVSKKSGMTKLKAQDLILGIKNSEGVRLGGLASEDVMVLGLKDKVKSLFKINKKPKPTQQILIKQEKIEIKIEKKVKSKIEKNEKKIKILEDKKLVIVKKQRAIKIKEANRINAKSRQDFIDYEQKYMENIKNKNSSSEVRKYSSANEIEKEYKLTNNTEVEIELKSREAARYFTQNHSLFHKYKFGTPTSAPGSEWIPFKSNLSKSKFYGKYVGFEKKLKNGNYARYRLDWDPNKKAHYNAEMTVIDEMGKTKNIKFATKFKCNGVPCTEDQINAFVERMQQIGKKK